MLWWTWSSYEKTFLWLVSSVCMWWRSWSTISAFFSEAWFSLYGKVNFQNTQYWSAEHSRLIHIFPFNHKKIWCLLCDKWTQDSWTQLMLPGMWTLCCAHFLWPNRIRKATLFSSKILQHLIQHMKVWKQCTRFSVTVLSCCMWPPCSLYLTPCDFYSWGCL
jgi:hypothetical protein